MMRLLQRDDDGKYKFTPDLSRHDTPPYAVLSHTWGADEVQFADLANSQDGIDWQRRDAYTKLKFCADQASEHGLRYFWIDTCCIDKSAYTELQSAINSMFRWYRDAERCYVYLADVSSPSEHGRAGGTRSWEAAFRESRWFTRGWTLQELIAPKKVDFYSKEGHWLGDKRSLESIICDVTGIPASALRDNPLHQFSEDERESWLQNRQTRYEEDLAYSLLGIFDVFLPLIYGEGFQNAKRRLREEVQRVKGMKARHNIGASVRLGPSEMSQAQPFVARDRELAEMHDILASDIAHNIVVLQGVGGIGKTELAVAFIKKYRYDRQDVFWIDSKDDESTQRSFTNIARQILQQDPDTGYLSALDLQHEQDEVVEAVKAWFSSPKNTNWIIVFDDYGGRMTVDIRRFLPLAIQGSIIITTRMPKVNMGRPVCLQGTDSTSDCIKLLSAASNWHVLGNDKDSLRLVERLDGNPLAIASAGAYVRHTATSFGEYLAHFEKQLDSNTSWTDTQQDRILNCIWQLSYNEVQDRNPLAAHLLQLWTCIDSEDMWLGLLQPCAQQIGPNSTNKITQESDFEQAMDILHDFRLVERHGLNPYKIEPNGYRVHKHLHAWMVNTMKPDDSRDMQRLVIKCIASNLTSLEALQSWTLQQRFLAHAVQLCGTLQDDDRDLAGAFHKIGHLLANNGKAQMAEDMYLRALRGYEKIWGPDHAETLNTVNSLGVLYAKQGKLQEAEFMYNRALRGYEAALGPDHTETARTVYNLGIVYADQGMLQQAQAMFGRALHGYEKGIGPGHTASSRPSLSTTWNLQPLLQGQSKPAEAYKNCQRALDNLQVIREFSSENDQSCKNTLLDFNQSTPGTTAVPDESYRSRRRNWFRRTLQLLFRSNVDRR